MADAGWREVADEDGNIYYYNDNTYESSWEPPPGWDAGAAAAGAVGGGDAAVAADGGGAAAAADAGGEAKTTKWVECDDPDSGAKYYYNNETGECVWEKPADYDGDGTKPSGELLEKIFAAKVKLARLDADTREKVKKAQAEQAKLKASGEKPEWVECYDPGSDSFYYFNNKTQETVWEKPANYIMAADDDMMMAVVKIQCLYRARMAKRKTRSERRKSVAAKEAAAFAVEDASGGDKASTPAAAEAKPEEKKADESGPWMKVKDEGSGQYYYYNNETGECTWDTPDGFKGAEADMEDEELVARIIKAKLMLATMDKDMYSSLQKGRKLAEDAKKSKWVEKYDPASKSFYYYNKDTNEQTWEKPADYKMVADDTMIVAVVKIQCLFRRMIARRGVDLIRKSPWIEVKDEMTGKMYYFNEKTQEVTWDKPDDYAGKTLAGAAKGTMEKILRVRLKRATMDTKQKAAVDKHLAEMKAKQKKGADWVATLDQDSGTYYYWNKVTNEQTWERPAEYVMAADDELMIAVVKVQALFRMKLGSRGFQAAKAAKAKSPWTKVKDEASGKYYYYNEQTEEVTWDQPAEFLGKTTDDADDELMGKIIKARLKRATMDDETRRKVDEHLRSLAAAKASGATDTWVEVYDPTNEAFYYHNKLTGEVVWDKPDHYVMAADDETMMAVVKLQNMFRHRIARRRAQAMIHAPTNITNEAAEEARQRMKKLNEEEAKMKKEMEDLRKKKEDEKRLKRELAKRSKEEQAAYLLEQEEAARLERISDQQREAQAERRRARRRRREAERARREERERKLAEMKRRMDAKYAAERRAKEEAERKAREEKEARDARRRAAEEAKEAQHRKDVADWKNLWAQTKVQEANRQLKFDNDREMSRQSRADEVEARESFKDDRARLQDASVQSVWDAAMSGVTDARAEAIVNLAIMESVEAQKAEARGEKFNAGAGAAAGAGSGVRPIRASVGTSTDSPALWHVNVGNELGESPLHVAAWTGQLAMCRALLDAGADVNLKDCAHSATTPLHLAARAGWRPIVRLLVERGASVRDQDSHGDTPLHCAARRGDRGMCQLLLEAVGGSSDSSIDFFNKVGGGFGSQDPRERMEAFATIANHKKQTPYKCASNDNCRVLLRQYDAMAMREVEEEAARAAQMKAKIAAAEEGSDKGSVAGRRRRKPRESGASGGGGRRSSTASSVARGRGNRK